MISKGLDFTSFVYLMTLTSYKPTEEKEINDDIEGVGFHIICLLNDTYQL